MRILITLITLCICWPSIRGQFSPNYGGNNYGYPSNSQSVFANFEELNRRLAMLQQSTRNDYSPIQQFPSPPSVPSYQPQFPASVVSQNSGQFPDYSRPPQTSQPIYSIPLYNAAQQQLRNVAERNSGQFPDPSRPPPPPIDYSIPLQPQSGGAPQSTANNPLSVSYSVQHGSYQARPQPQYSVPTPPQFQPSSPPAYPPANAPQYAPQPAYKQAQTHYANIGSQLLGDYKFGYKTEDGGSFREEIRNADGSVQGSYGFVDANGKQRVVKYTAGKEGFRAEGDDVPSAPAINSLQTSHSYPSSQSIPAPYQSQPVRSYTPSQSQLNFNDSPAFKSFSESLQG